MNARGDMSPRRGAASVDSALERLADRIHRRLLTEGTALHDGRVVPRRTARWRFWRAVLGDLWRIGEALTAIALLAGAGWVFGRLLGLLLP